MEPSFVKNNEVRLTLHHVGCLVDDIQVSINSYRLLFAEISEVFHIASQHVYVCFVNVAPGVFLELVQPTGEESVVYKLRKKGGTYYHTGFWVNDFDNALEELEKQGYRHINTFHSEAFQQRRCAFLYAPEMELVEIIETESTQK